MDSHAVARYISCLLILKCPFYAQVRIHLVLSVSSFILFFPGLLVSLTDVVHNKYMMRARILSISFANAIRTKCDNRDGRKDGARSRPPRDTDEEDF